MNNRHFLVPNVSTEAVVIGPRYFYSLYQNNRFLGNGGPSKIRLQYFIVFGFLDMNISMLPVCIIFQNMIPSLKNMEGFFKNHEEMLEKSKSNWQTLEITSKNNSDTSLFSLRP